MNTTTPPQEAAVWDLVWLAGAFHAVTGYLDRTHAEPAGPPFARFTFLDGVVAVEAGFPVPEEIAGAGPVEPSALPDGPAAVTTHTGRYEDLGPRVRRDPHMARQPPLRRGRTTLGCVLHRPERRARPDALAHRCRPALPDCVSGNGGTLCEPPLRPGCYT